LLRYPLFLILLSLVVIPTHTRNYKKFDYEWSMAKTAYVKGEVVLFGNREHTFQYLNKGNLIPDQSIIRTKKGSQVLIRFKDESTLRLGPQTKVRIQQINSRGIKKLTLFKGNAIYHSKTPGRGSLIIQHHQQGHGVMGRHFAVRSRGPNMKIFSKGGARVYKIKNIVAQSHPNIFRAKKLGLLKKRLRKLPLSNASTPEESPKESLTNTETSPSTSSSAEAELADIFGEEVEQVTIPEKVPTSPTKIEQEIDDIFSDTSGTQEKLSVVKEEKEKKTGPINYPKVIDDREIDANLDVSFFMRSSAYFSPPPEVSKNDSRVFHGEGRLILGNKTRIDDKSSISLLGHIEFGNRKNVYRRLGDTFDFRNEKRGNIVFNEFYYLESFDKFDFTIGKKIYRMGKGLVFSPTDRITPTDQIVPVSSLSLGGFLTSIDYYQGDHTFSIVVLPWPIPSKTPPQFSRWAQQIDGREFPFKTEFPGGIKSWQTLLKFETTFSGWDIFASIFNGANPDPVIRTDITVTNNEPDFVLVKEHIPITNFATGFSTTFGKLELHGEYLKQNASDGKDDSYSSQMLGFRLLMDEWPTLIGLDQIDFVLEKAWETIQQPITAPFYALSSITSRVFQDSWMGTLIFKVSDRFVFNYDFNFDQKNNGAAQFLGFTYTTKEKGSFRARIESFGGDETGLFGIYDKNDNLSLQYTFNY
jgi:hypothetical protein